MEIKRLPLGLNKRHLIVGDIHGRYDELMALLETANYDPSNDVLYSVGDMIDRGPKSYEVIDFFTSNENVHAVMGNHELMAYEDSWFGVWVSNGGMNCLESLENNGVTIDWLTDKIRSLPWAIEVGEEDEEHSFRIVHAEVPAQWSDAYFTTLMETSTASDDPEVATTIWSRSLIHLCDVFLNLGQNPANKIVFDVNRKRNNFVGHTPVDDVFNVGDAWYLDTGTISSRKLSMIDAISKEVYSVPYTPI